MNWKDYIKSIRNSDIVDGSLESIMTTLFKIAGCMKDPSPETVKSWLYERRNCTSDAYFPNGTIKVEGVFRYFRNRPDSKLYNLQKIFENQISPNSDSPIDVKTTDLDIFCWSLVNQFLDLLKLERIDIPKDVAANQEQAIEEQPNSAVSMELAVSADASNSEKRSIRSVILPHNDDCCYHCAHWEGSRRTFGAYTVETYGRCIKYNRERQLSSDLPCRDYKKRTKLFGDW